MSGRVLTAAGAWRLRQFHLGGGVQYFSFEAGPPLPQNPARPHEMLVTGALVYRFGLLAAGASAKVVNTSTGGVRERGVGGDLGLAIAVFDIMAIGFSVQNLSGNFERNSALAMPRLTRLGFTMNYVDPQESFRLLSALEIQWPEGRGARGVIGGEAGTVIRGLGVVGRLAYGSRWAAYQPSAVTYGGSLVLSRLTFDYCFEPAETGTSRHRLGVRFTW
jgi:hypothetical protein